MPAPLPIVRHPSSSWQTLDDQTVGAAEHYYLRSPTDSILPPTPCVQAHPPLIIGPPPNGNTRNLCTPSALACPLLLPYKSEPAQVWRRVRHFPPDCDRVEMDPLLRKIINAAIIVLAPSEHSPRSLRLCGTLLRGMYVRIMSNEDQGSRPHR